MAYNITYKCYAARNSVWPVNIESKLQVFLSIYVCINFLVLDILLHDNYSYLFFSRVYARSGYFPRVIFIHEQLSMSNFASNLIEWWLEAQKVI